LQCFRSDEAHDEGTEGTPHYLCEALHMSWLRSEASEMSKQCEGVPVRNDRLRDAMRVVHVSEAQVARDLQVDPKTVTRWLREGRLPREQHRRAIARLLHVSPNVLWPDVRLAGADSTGELIAAYAHRADVPTHQWRSMFAGAEERIDLLGYALLFLPESCPGLVDLLRRKGEAGACVRISFVDPSCASAVARDAEEGLSEGLLARIRTAMKYFRGVEGCAGVDVRCHTAPMYNSTFRWDDEMFVTPHLYGLPGYHAPLLHLKRRGEDGIFDNFAVHFEALWTDSLPIVWPS